MKTFYLWTNLKCSPLPILSLSGVDRHDCLSPCFSVLCELWVELVLSQIAPHSVHPPQSWPSRCFLLCNVRLFSSYGHTTKGVSVWHVVIGLTIALLLNFSFLILSFLFCPESILAFSSFAALLCVAPNTRCTRHSVLQATCCTGASHGPWEQSWIKDGKDRHEDEQGDAT